MTQKSVKSLQNFLNEAEIYLSNFLQKDLQTVSKGAYSQARSNLSHKAFIELAQDVRDKFYEDGAYKKYKDFRLLGVDGSLITLPNNSEIQKEFTTTNVVNQYKDKNKKIVQARVSLLYDLLNSIVVDAVITDTKTHEITITKEEHLCCVRRGDLIIFDRGYPSYELFASIVYIHRADYLIRMKKSFYKKYTAPLFDKTSEVNDIIVTLTPPTKEVEALCADNSLPMQQQVRFVRVVLDNGEIEVLATSVLDTDLLKTADFKELYFKRWKIETHYEIVKNRLALENFTGTTPLAIKQDFYATMFISNIEAIVSYDLDEELKSQKCKKKYTQKTNKSVSFNTIKNHAFELFLFEEDIAQILDKIYQLLKTNKVAVRPDRKHKRPSHDEGKNTKGIKSSNYYKRYKKIVF